MGGRGYRLWTHAEEDNLEGWVAQHLELTWDERAEEYSQTVCPRSSESLRSKLRQIKRGIRRRQIRQLQRSRDAMVNVVGRRQQAALAPSRPSSCPRYVPGRQIDDHLHDLPLTQGHPANRKPLSAQEKAASRLLDELHGLKRPGFHERMDVTPPSHGKIDHNVSHARTRSDADSPSATVDAVAKRPAWSSQLSPRTPPATNLLWRVVCRLASRRRR